MHLSALYLLVIASLSRASPFKFPLRNGFPFPRDAALDELFTRAGGNFTNMPLAPKFDDDSLISWKLQAFNEFMEVAFFTQLISNITKRIPGYELDREQESYVLKSLEAIQAVSTPSSLLLFASGAVSNLLYGKERLDAGHVSQHVTADGVQDLHLNSKNNSTPTTPTTQFAILPMAPTSILAFTPSPSLTSCPQSLSPRLSQICTLAF